MNPFRRLCASAALLLALSAPAVPAFAQDDAALPAEEEEEIDYSAVIVTGAVRVRQGGAQDIKHFRSISLDGEFLPPASSLTLEGLLGEHDLTLPSQRECHQLFCLATHSMRAALPGRPQDEIFVGLGFESGIDAAAYRAVPLSLVAVVDRSGSMEGEPIARVKEGLRAILAQMRRGDRLGIVIYGDDTLVHLPVTDVAGNEAAIRRAIETIEIDGSTYLEAGLKLGYATAFEELARSRGKTRLMLFTDENPNVGNTTAEGFMGQALAGSRKGVGLTTIGVGVHFDADLATRVASVRGGNLFFLDSEGDADKLFAKEYFNMVSEVAHDVAITIDPADGYKVTGVFGVPDNLMTSAPDGTITVTVGSTFLSSNGGGVYASLGKETGAGFLPAADLQGAAPARIAITYLDAVSGKRGEDAIEVAPLSAQPPERLVTAHLLVDEYLALTGALELYHAQGDKKGAFQALDGLSQRLSQAKIAGLDKERATVAGLRDRAAYMAGYRGELTKAMRPLALIGDWRVTRVSGVEDLSVGDTVSLTPEGDFITQRMSGAQKGEAIDQSFQVNETRLMIESTGLVLRYSLEGETLRMRDSSGTSIVLERLAAAS